MLLGQCLDEVNQQLVAQQLLALSDMQKLAWQRFTPAYFRRLLWLRGSIILLLSLVITLLLHTQLITLSTGILLLGVSALWLLADWWAYRRWHGFYLQDQVLYLWRGGIGQCWQILPLRQVQKCSWYNRCFCVSINWCSSGSIRPMAASLWLLFQISKPGIYMPRY